jgi:hypothetical protein
MKKIIYSVIFLVNMQMLYTQTPVTGDLAAYVNTFISGMPNGNGTDEYQTPTATQLTRWGNILTNILQGQYAAANDTAALIDYRLLEYTDNTITPNRLYYVLEKTTSGANYWGMFIYYPNAARPQLFVMCPHPKNDTNTGQEGFLVFKNDRARAYIVAGTNRCNSSLYTTCEGTITSCTGSSEASRKSDQPHNVDDTFQKSTEILIANIANLVVLQVHGFSKGTGDPDAIIGNGTYYSPSGTDYANILKSSLELVDTSLVVQAVHIDGSTENTGTTNTQGRLLNGNSVPCTQNNQIANGRFLHVEQALTGLRNSQSNWNKLVRAIALAIPIPSVVAGNWNQTSTWSGGVIPDSASSAMVAANQTITVDDNNAKCFSVFFGGTSSKIAMSTSGILNVYGDFNLYSTSHTAFSSWASGAKLKFRGSAPQVFTNLSTNETSTTQTFFMEIQVDKSGDTLRTPNSNVKLNLSTSLEILNGNFILGSTSDIQGRSFDGSSAATPTITVQSNGIFNMLGSTSYIRSGSNIGADNSKIGKMTVYGIANLAPGDNTNRVNLNGVDIESGGVVTTCSGRSVATGSFNPGTITIKNGGTYIHETTTGYWYTNSTTPTTVNLNSGGEFNISASNTSYLPQVFINSGTVRYSNSSLAQNIRSILSPYQNLILSGGNTKTLDGPITVNGTLSLRGTASLSLGSSTLIYGSSAILQYGASSQISAQTTSDAEFPATGGPNNLTIYNSGGVTLHASRSLNGTLAFTNGYLILNSNNLTLGSSATIAGIPSSASMIVTNGVGEIRKVFTNIGSFTYPVGDTTGTDEYSPVTLNFTSGTYSSAYTGIKVANNKHQQNTSNTDYLKRYWTVTQSGISNFLCNADFIYTDGDIIGTESNIVLAKYSSGVWNVVGTSNTGTNTLSAIGLNSFSDFTGGEQGALPVQLISFCANFIKDKTVELQWQTLSEINNYGFNIQRYQNDYRVFENIGFVAGTGTTTEQQSYKYTDEQAVGTDLEYRLEQVDNNGLKHYYGPILLTPNDVRVDEIVPSAFKLEPNYPNPFNPTTSISFSLATSGFTTLKVYNMVGCEVASLFNRFAESGKKYLITFNATNFVSGIYYYKLCSGKDSQIQKMVLIK